MSKLLVMVVVLGVVVTALEAGARRLPVGERWHARAGYATFGEAPRLRDRGRWLPLPAHDALETYDGLETADFLQKREIIVADRRWTPRVRFRRGGVSNLEMTHPADVPPRHGPNHPTQPHLALGGSGGEWWDGARWREGAGLLFFRDRVLVTIAGVPCLELGSGGMTVHPGCG